MRWHLLTRDCMTWIDMIGSVSGEDCTGFVDHHSGVGSCAVRYRRRMLSHGLCKTVRVCRQTYATLVQQQIPLFFFETSFMELGKQREVQSIELPDYSIIT